ncbi:hypothetical protein HDU97_002913 [Phlyctochytrium planicorne]|nr:hypothetical protein HDU97_002913 [Phlyctochytrium planicorne]
MKIAERSPILRQKNHISPGAADARRDAGTRSSSATSCLAAAVDEKVVLLFAKISQPFSSWIPYQLLTRSGFPSVQPVATARPKTTYVEEVKVAQPFPQPEPEVPKSNSRHHETKSQQSSPSPASPQPKEVGFVAHSITNLDEDNDSSAEVEVVMPQSKPDTQKKSADEKQEEAIRALEEETRQKQAAGKGKADETGEGKKGKKEIVVDDDDAQSESSNREGDKKGKLKVEVPPQGEDDEEEEEEEEEEDAGPPKVVNAFGAETVPKTQQKSQKWFQKSPKKEKTKESPVMVYKATSLEMTDNIQSAKQKRPLAKSDSAESDLEPTDEAIVEGEVPAAMVYASDESLGGGGGRKQSNYVNSHVPASSATTEEAHPFGFFD